MGKLDTFSSSSPVFHVFVSPVAHRGPCTRVEPREPQSGKSSCVPAVELGRFKVQLLLFNCCAQSGLDGTRCWGKSSSDYATFCVQQKASRFFFFFSTSSVVKILNRSLFTQTPGVHRAGKSMISLGACRSRLKLATDSTSFRDKYRHRHTQFNHINHDQKRFLVVSKYFLL